MKKFFGTFILSFLSIQSAIADQAVVIEKISNCEYGALPSPEYKFNFNKGKEPKDIFYGELYNGVYSPTRAKDVLGISDKNFKVYKTNLKRTDREQKIVSQRIDDKNIYFNSPSVAQLITNDCSVYYADTYALLDAKEGVITKATGGIVNYDDLRNFIGESYASGPKPLGYEVKYDKFDKVYKINTEEKDRNILRASIDANTKKIQFIQLYTSVGFGNDWGNIQSAVDLDSKRHKVVRIDSDTKCFGGGLRCYNTEILGIDIDRPFLEKYRNGFELKLVGKVEVEISVSKESIDAFFMALDEAKGKN